MAKKRAKNASPRAAAPSLVKTRGRPRASLGADFARGKVLRGAADLFGRKGIDGVTVEDLLQVAGVSRRTFYKLFRDQAAVLAALFEVATESFARALESALDQAGPPARKIERCIDAYLGFHKTEGSLMRVLQAEARRPGSSLAPRRARIMARIAAALGRVVKPVRGKRVDPLVYEALLVALEGVSVWISDQSAGTARDLRRARAVMMRVAIATLAGALAARTLPPLPTT